MKHPALELILASSSPRRKFLLESLGIIPHIIPSHFDEDSIVFRGNPAQYVLELAENKAAVIRKEYPNSFVLAADTTVYHAGRVINKPQSLEEAIAMLSSLSGSTHKVYTGIAIAKGDIIRTEVAETSVRFFPLSPEHIEAYVRTQPVLDKAGGYAIQGAGALLVERIDGCYYNVMGLPLSTVGKLLNEFGVNIWEYVCGI